MPRKTAAPLDQHLTAPPLRLLLLEGRAFFEYASFIVLARLLRDLPRGDGHPVMVVPGFGQTDATTAPMRRVLGQLGYAVYGWEQGRNLGMRPKIKDNLGRRLQDLQRRHDAKVSLIGWSLGGVYVREMARALPQSVRRVITLGSPINGHPDANNVASLFRLLNRGKDVKMDLEGFNRRRVAPPVPCTAIYSKSDGIVAWRCSMEEPASNTESVEVRGSHSGFGFNPQVMRVIAERLALPAA